MLRQVTDTVTQFPNGFYFVDFEGDELLLEGVTNDEDAIVAAEILLHELEEAA